MKKISAAALVVGLVFSTWVAAEDISKPNTDFVYQVKAGDTLSKLANQLWDKPARWQEVAAYNQLGNANQIEVGQKLRIRLPWLKKQSGKAVVEALTGTVKSNGKLLRVTDEISVGEKLETASAAALRLRLPDGSIINLLEQSQLHMDLLEHSEGSSFKTLLRLVTGQVEAFKKKYAKGEADLSIRAKSATLGVRGTHFRMRQTQDHSFAEIEEGLVSLDAEKTPQALALAGGQGSVADGIHAAEVVPLLAAPSFPILPAVFETPYVEWKLADLAGAQSFIGELAQDERFSKNVMSVQSVGQHMSFAELPNGQYWLRLRAVDVHGLQGMEGKVAFSVQVKPRAMALVKAYISSEVVQLRWMGRSANVSYQVQVADNQEFNQPLLDEETAELTAEIARPVSGRYFVRVRQVTSDRHADQWDAPVMFEVRSY